MRYNLPVDKKAPRFRRPAKCQLNQSFHRKIRRVHPDLTISNPDIKKIIHKFHEECINVIANTRDGLELPLQMGFIIVGGFEKNDFELKNWETNRRMCKIFYTNLPVKYKFKFHELWGFAAGRLMKKVVSNSFKKNHANFYYASDDKISRLFKVKDRLGNKLAKINKKLDEHT